VKVTSSFDKLERSIRARTTRVGKRGPGSKFQDTLKEKPYSAVVRAPLPLVRLWKGNREVVKLVGMTKSPRSKEMEITSQ